MLASDACGSVSALAAEQSVRRLLPLLDTHEVVAHQASRTYSNGVHGLAVDYM